MFKKQWHFSNPELICYREALNAIETLMANDPHPESAEGEQLELLSTLVADYESRVFPSTLPDPVEAIKFRMEQASLKPADLVPFIGSKSRVSEILSGKRKLTVEMMLLALDGLVWLLLGLFASIKILCG